MKIQIVLTTAVAVSSLLIGRGSSASSFEGFTEPLRTIQIASPETGIIKTLAIEEGQRIEANTPIAHLDDVILLTALKLAKAKADANGRVNAAETAARLQQQRFNQLKLLLDRGHANQEEVDRAHADWQIAAANVTSAQEDALLSRLEVEQIEAQIARRTVLSPSSGTIVKVHKEQGEFIASGDLELATLVQLDALRVRLYVDTAVAERLREGQAIRLEFPDRNQTARANIAHISPVTDSGSGTVRVEAVIPNQRGVYRSGVRCVFEVN